MNIMICESLRQNSCIESLAKTLAEKYFQLDFKNLTEIEIVVEIKKLRSEAEKEEYEKVRNSIAHLVQTRKFYDPKTVNKTVFNSMLTFEKLVNDGQLGYDEAAFILRQISKQVQHDSDYNSYQKTLDTGG